MRGRGAWAAWAVTGLFLAAVAPFFLMPHRLTLAVFGATGRLLLPLTPFRARVADNAALVRPDMDHAAVRRLTAAVGDNFGRVLAEYIQMRSFRARRAQRSTTGIGHLTQALAQGRGAILVSAHFGSWEAVRLAALDAGVEVAIIYRAFNNPAFDVVSKAKIRLAGEPVIHKGAPGLKALVRHLRGGGAILILLDQRISGGAMLPFLGRDALTAVSIAALSARLGAPMIPACGLRRPDGASFDVVFEPPVAMAAPEAMMAAVNARYDAWVARAPGQWFWLHRRWK